MRFRPTHWTRWNRVWRPAHLDSIVCESWADEGVTLAAVPRSQGTTPPVLTYSGTLTGGIVPYVQCDSVAGGTAVGQATVKVSYDDGATFPHTGVATSSTPTALPGVGSAILASFAAGTFNTNNIWEALTAQVNDLTGNANHASQATAANQIIIRAKGFNGKPCFDWGTSGTTNRKMSTPSVSLGAFSVFMVLRGDASAGHPFVHNVDAGANGCYIFGATPGDRIERGGVVTAKTPTPWLRDSTRKTIALTYGGAHATNLLYANGSVLSPADTASADPGTATASGAIHIGAQQAGNSPFRGVIAGWVVGSRAWTANEVSFLHAYATQSRGFAL